MGSCRDVLAALAVVLSGLELPATQPRDQVPRAPEALPAQLSLSDREVAYGGLGEESDRTASRGDVFGWHDGSIRFVGQVDTAGGCADPSGIRATLHDRTVRVEILAPGQDSGGALACPAVFTPHVIYARVTGLKPGRYHLSVVTARWVSLPLPESGVHVPAPQPR
jgi:hypothetical protein